MTLRTPEGERELRVQAPLVLTEHAVPLKVATGRAESETGAEVLELVLSIPVTGTPHELMRFGGDDAVLELHRI